MLVVGIILIIAGIVLFFVQKYYKEKLYSIKSALPSTVSELYGLSEAVAKEIGKGSWQSYVKLSGIIKCDAPLISELKQQPCVYYSMKVVREYEETVTKRDSEGNSTEETQRGSEVVASNSQSITFYLHDGTGLIAVNPSKANIQTVSVLNEFRPGDPSASMLSFGGFSLVLGNTSSGRRTVGYRYTESILPLERNAFIVGLVTDSTSELTLQKPVSPGQKFVISLNSEAELASSTVRVANYTFYAMLVCFVSGIILSIAGLVANTSAPPPSAVKSAPESNIAQQKPISGINVAAGKQVIARSGGITYPSWGNANDLVDHKTTTNYPQLGRWGNETNNGKGTFQVVDLSAVYSLNGVGYNIDWDKAFKNPLTFRVEVSTDNKTWRLASEIVHPYSATSGDNKLDIDVAIQPFAARYVKYWEPPDGEWNGWGTFHQLRAYSPKK